MYNALNLLTAKWNKLMEKKLQKHALYVKMLHTHTQSKGFIAKKVKNDNVLSFIYENDMTNAFFL